MEFNRDIEPIKQLGLGRTVLDELKDHKIARPMNTPWKDADFHKNPDAKVWINPHDQFCFNSMWCTADDLRQWMEGKGPMVKGETDEEKKKYWDYAVFEENEDPWEINHSKWLVKYTWPWHEKFVTDFDPHHHGGHGIEQEIKHRLKLRNNRTKDHLENKIRTEEAIKAMMVPFVDMIVRELEYREWGNVRREVEHDLYGIKRTLYCLGYGYLGACNTPEEISNLHWVPDIIFGKAIYLWLKKQNYPLPDFEWLVNRKNKDDEGVVNKVLKDTYSAIAWPKGSVITVSHETKKRGWLSRTAGHGITVNISLTEDVDWKKKIVKRTVVTETAENISNNPEVRDKVRKMDEAEDSPDKYATINAIYPDGKIWVANLNMPYMGSISKVYSREEFDKTFEIIK